MLDSGEDVFFESTASRKLVDLIERNADELTTSYVEDIRRDPRMPSYQGFDQKEIYKRAYRVYSQLGKWVSHERRYVGRVEIEVGVRVPAWLVRPDLADFGTVFWELFTDRVRRKLFGSEVRNAKGDWDVQIAASSPIEVWAGLHLAESYDPSRPIGMY